MLNGRSAVSNVAVGFLSIAFLSMTAIEARAQAADLKECATQYQAAKADNKLGGQSWQDFYTACKAGLAAVPAAKTEPVAAAPSPESKSAPETPATEAAPATPTPEKAESAASPKPDNAALEKKCRAEWKAKEAVLKKKDPKASWEKFWKQCGSKS